jgi:hypothetical protein
MVLRQMIGKPARWILESLSAIRPRYRDALRIVLAESRAPARAIKPTMEHLQYAMNWLKTAQDVVKSGGVSWGYCARSRAFANKQTGWLSAYPETTGYIIGTLVRYAELANDPDFLDRAQKLADWEITMQLDDGGVPGGTVGAVPVSSSTFVTGQVIFGWLTAYEQFHSSAYLNAAQRAGDYLVSCLDDEGRFVRGYSHFCKPGPKAYESRTAWALALLGKVSHRAEYLTAAKRIGNWVLSVGQPNGWYRDNALEDSSIPLTHTIGYLLEGLLELSFTLDETVFLDACVRSLGVIQDLVEPNGFLAGRWTADWQPAADWCCLTGSAQLARVFLLAHRARPRHDFFLTGEKLLGFVASTQLLQDANQAMAGGIHGSYPFGGGYGPYCILNWANKFYADALMDYFEAVKSLDPPATRAKEASVVRGSAC